MNPTLVQTRMGKAALSDPTLSESVLSRTPLGKFAGNCFIDNIDSIDFKTDPL